MISKMARPKQTTEILKQVWDLADLSIGIEKVLENMQDLKRQTQKMNSSGKKWSEEHNNARQTI